MVVVYQEAVALRTLQFARETNTALVAFRCEPVRTFRLIMH